MLPALWMSWPVMVVPIDVKATPATPCRPSAVAASAVSTEATPRLSGSPLPIAAVPAAPALPKDWSRPRPSSDRPSRPIEVRASLNEPDIESDEATWEPR